MDTQTQTPSGKVDHIQLHCSLLLSFLPARKTLFWLSTVFFSSTEATHSVVGKLLASSPAKGLALMQALLCHWRALTEQYQIKPADSHQWLWIRAMTLTDYSSTASVSVCGRTAWACSGNARYVLLCMTHIGHISVHVCAQRHVA